MFNVADFFKFQVSVSPSPFSIPAHVDAVSHFAFYLIAQCTFSGFEFVRCCQRFGFRLEFIVMASDGPRFCGPDG